VQPNRTIRTRPTQRLLDVKRVSSGSPLEAQIGFSRAVRVGNFIAVAGTAPIPSDSSKVDTWTVYHQTRLCLQIVRKAIEEAGGRLENNRPPHSHSWRYDSIAAQISCCPGQLGNWGLLLSHSERIAVVPQESQ
jgi:Endoribonuclease L-PSP